MTYFIYQYLFDKNIKKIFGIYTPKKVKIWNERKKIQFYPDSFEIQEIKWF